MRLPMTIRRTPRLLSLLGPVAVLIAASVALGEASRPNILLIFADDLGWKDVSYQGTDYYETPNIDRLAEEAMVFTDGYAAAGNCAPSRACLLSGTYTPRHHVYAVGSTDRGPKKLQRLVPIPNKSGLARESVTLADALQASGYATGLFGKWHLDGKDGCEPTKQGFEVYFDSRKKDPNASKGRIQHDPKGIFSLTEAATRFIETNVAVRKPFFAMVSHHAIHAALEARQATLDCFESKPKGSQHDQALYAACTKDLDTGVGMLLAKLDEFGIRTNTLVVFTSDNGGTQRSSQEPLRGNKGCYYEGGIREPFLVRWPGVTRAGSRCDVPVINVDLYPTFLAAAGAAVPEGKVLDGENLVPLLRGGSLQRQSIFWHFPGYLNDAVIRGRDPVFRTRPVSVIRKGDWKLHLYHEEWQLDGGRAGLSTNNAVELYQMRKDIGEHNNLAQKEVARRDELLDDLLQWFKQTDALLPSEPNSQFDPQ